MSFWTRLSQDARNSWKDAYSSVILGDEAGKSARLCVVVTGNEVKELGLQLVEINGRAYVHSVANGSMAHQAGVLPRDAVQLAIMYQQQQEEDDENDVSTMESKAQAYALDCENKGLRMGYEDLRRFFASYPNLPPSLFLSPPPPSSSSTNRRHTMPPIPSTILCAPDTTLSEQHVNTTTTSKRSSSSSTSNRLVLLLRRTRQRPSRSNVWGLSVNFRMDDECDFASSLLQRLAPTHDMEVPLPDAWEEMVHDGTDWLLGSGSMLPPKRATTHSTSQSNSNGPTHTTTTTRPSDPTLAPSVPQNDASHPRNGNSSSIPWDNYETERHQKLATLKSRMAAEFLPTHSQDDVEATTLRAMIQKAVGLAFCRASKVVLGVSVHGGSGIVLSRLSDGTWSAPSAIGTWGLGFGLQFGLEVAEYIFILQTEESLEHFRRGGSFTVGGNVGAAVAGMGREAYGAASIAAPLAGGGGVCGGNYNPQPDVVLKKEDEYNDETDEDVHGGVLSKSNFGIAPIVAYAKSQGLYVGVSLEGSRIFTRNDVNARAYQFSSGKPVTAHDILSGKVPTPPEAEDLYATLHSVEFTHEMSILPRPPEILRKDSPHSWYYDRSTLGNSNNSNTRGFSFLQDLTHEESEECAAFETQFKKFMYGGVSVQRLLIHSETSSGKTRKERRTLWLMLPEVGALRLGFVSKLSDGDGAAVSNKSSTQRANNRDNDTAFLEGDVATVASEEVTLDSALLEKDESKKHIRRENVQLSNKHSVALTDVTLLSQETDQPVRFSSEDQTEHLRVLSIKDVSGTSLLFLANNFREAELLYCGLKLLLERETARLGVRGGLPISTLGRSRGSGSAMGPSAARGVKDSASRTGSTRSKSRRDASGYASSELASESDMDRSFNSQGRDQLPEGRQKWGNVPGRNYMRGQAAKGGPGESTQNGHGENSSAQGIPKYVHGQLLFREIATNVQLPLPLPLCRVLLLDSSSPVISKWEKDRGDSNYSRTTWTFPPATPRELEQHDSEHQLIASGSMMGAHRTTTFDRPRNGTVVPLSETQIVDADDSEKLAFTVSERMPRRGFSIKVRMLLRSSKANSCEASVTAEVRPVGKNMANQAAVQKAFLLVLNEIKMRYGSKGKGLIAGFLKVIEDLPSSERVLRTSNGTRLSRSGVDGTSRPFNRTDPQKPERNSNGQKASESGLVSFEDIMKSRNGIPEPEFRRSSGKPSTAAINAMNVDPDLPKKKEQHYDSNEFADMPLDEQEDMESKKASTIEVKPLPKIRLSLMPSPREEDEEENSSGPVKKKKKKKKKSRRHSSSARRNVAFR